MTRQAWVIAVLRAISGIAQAADAYSSQPIKNRRAVRAGQRHRHGDATAGPAPAGGTQDVLRDEGEAFAKRAQREGVAVNLVRATAMNHGFMKYAGLIDEATQSVKHAGQWLRANVGARATA
jgi:acetyl esterase/lipase